MEELGLKQVEKKWLLQALQELGATCLRQACCCPRVVLITISESILNKQMYFSSFVSI